MKTTIGFMTGVAGFLFAVSAQAEISTSTCTGEDAGKKIELTVVYDTNDVTADGPSSIAVSIGGKKLHTFAPIGHGFQNYGTEANPFMLTTESAEDKDGKLSLYYPEQDPEQPTLSGILSVELPADKVSLDGIEVNCVL